MHNGGGYSEVDYGWNQQGKEIAKGDYTFLPDQQRGDIAEGTEWATCIGGDHNIDAGQGNKAWAILTHSQNNRTHKQGGSEIVAAWRNKERLKAGNPE